MAYSRKRTSMFTCLVFLIMFAVSSFLMETTNLLDFSKNPFRDQRSVNDYFFGARDRTERNLKDGGAGRNTTVMSSADSFHLQSNESLIVDETARIALQDLFIVWDQQVREKAANEPFKFKLQSDGLLANDCSKISALPLNLKLHRSDDTVEVAFYEGNRFAWIYTSLFKKPQETRFCNECKFETNHTIRARLVKKAWSLKSYDIVIFPQDKGTKPMRRTTWTKILNNAPSHQRRVYATFEGPYKLMNAKSKRSFTHGEFHWSWTLNSKSEFTMPYGYYKPESLTKEVKLVNWAEGKTYLVAWMSSWVTTNWKRSKFVENLGKLIPVHMYGKKYRSCPKGSQSCKETIKKYKFYLALENSCCKEYITEKFWRSLFWGIVPVVVGASREDYERLAPPNSFIFADDFKSLKDLANYLLEIDKNDTLYNEFFRWRSQGTVHQNYPNYHRIPHEPPSSWFYSCNAVCKVTERYLREREEFVEPTSGFDPHAAKWWGRSCRKCGSQPWFKEFWN